MRRLPLALLFVAASAAAQPRAADLVAWTVRATPGARGGEARVVIRATIAPGWRLYAMDSPVGRPLTLTVDALPDGVAAGPPRQSAPREGYDEAFEQAYPYHAGRAELAVPLQVGRAARRGRHTVAGAVRYALCDDTMCLPPATAPFRTTLVVR